MLDISEDLFWNADICFLEGVAKNMAAYENWKTYARERMMKNGR